MPRVTRMSYSPRGLGGSSLRARPMVRKVPTQPQPMPISTPLSIPPFALPPARPMTYWDGFGTSLMLQTAMNASSSVALAAQAQAIQQQHLQQQAFAFSPNLPPVGPMGSLANFAIPSPEPKPNPTEPETPQPNPATEEQLKKIGITDKEAKRLHQLLNGSKPDRIIHASKLLGGHYLLATENARIFKGKANNLKEIAAKETLRTKCLDQKRVIETADGLQIELQLNPQNERFTGKLKQKWFGGSLPVIQRANYKL